MADAPSKTRSRKEPEPTDLAARLVQLQRRTAAETKPRSRADRPQLLSSPKSPELPKERLPSKDEFMRDTKKDEFSRNMPVTTTPRLYDPKSDPVAILSRRALEQQQQQQHHHHHHHHHHHQESMSDMDSNSPPRGVPPRSSHRPEPTSTRRLYDPNRDSPVRFTVLSKPPNPPAESVKPPSSHRSFGDHVSASSTSISSYPPSLGSTTFTLTSASSSSSFFNKNKEDPNSPVVAQLKRLYRVISQAERKVLDAAQDDVTSEQSRVVALQTRDQPVSQVIDPWARLIADHKELAELMHSFLTLTLSPQVPVSFHQYPTSYNIPSRLWTNAFHRILESLRRASSASPVALEHLSDLISYAYNFYASLYENPILDQYRLGWLEALGDLARYRMAVSAHMATAPFGERLSGLSIHNKGLVIPNDSKSGINDSQNPSVGPAAASALDIEPEREIWRKTARCWYAEALKDVPISGRLHHHLGVVSREGDDEELRAVYHFSKSMISSNPFPTARESILIMFTPAAQSRRMQPDALVSDLFLLLHGMLFTHIQLDDFAPTKARFMERLALDGAEEREWIMMGLINFVSIFEYGRHDGSIRKVTVSAALASSEASKNVTSVVSRTEDLRIVEDEDRKMDVDDAPERDTEQKERTIPSRDTPEPSHSFQLALELTFSMLSHVLRNPWRQANAFSRPSLNPYISLILTCLSSLTKHSKVIELLEHAIPWYDLVEFLNTIPRSVADPEFEHSIKSLTHGCAALPEDWCLRGTEWMRRAYERGFWKTDSCGEIAVLDMNEGRRGDETDGIIEADEDDTSSPKQDDTRSRFVRTLRSGVYLVRAVAGFDYDKTKRRWAIDDPLRDKVEYWREVERKEREADELRRTRRIAWSDDEDVMEVDGANGEEGQEEDSDDEEDSEQVKELKARRRHFRALLASQHNGTNSRLSSKRRRRPLPARSRVILNVVAGYTVLVIDTNILLSSLNLFSQLVESLKWTVVVPLAVVTELDGLATGDTQLGAAARAALDYLVSHLRSHSLSLKVQTSRGNYLSSLVIRREQVDLDDERSWERSMDDLILRAAIWQDEHWTDRSALLKVEQAKVVDTVSKVVLLSFDRNLRLKARSRELCAADERDMAVILST